MSKIIALAALALLATGTAGASEAAKNQNRPQATANMNFPDALRRAAIVASDDRTGQIAGARIDGTSTYVVYVKSDGGCGSGGCPAQVWKREGTRFIRGESMPVGRLPIVVLPQMSNGMPLLGVTVFDNQSAGQAIQPVGFDGRNYTQQSDDLMPANSGKPLLTQGMLRSF